MSESLGKESNLPVPSSLKDRLSDKLPPGYTELSVSSDATSPSCVVDCY